MHDFDIRAMKQNFRKGFRKCKTKLILLIQKDYTVIACVVFKPQEKRTVVDRSHQFEDITQHK